jgi:amino acid transporter
MDTKLQDQVLEWISSTAEKIGDFATTQIPPFINEYLTWKFIEALVTTSYVGGLLMILFVAFCLCIKRLVKWAKESSDDTDGVSWIVPIPLTVITIGIIIGNFPIDEIKTMIQIKVAPKVYLIESAAQLIKQ